MIVDAVVTHLSLQGVMDETFGHLRPDPTHSYSGEMVWAESAYEGGILVCASWDGLSDSPWLYDDMVSMWESLGLEGGKVYRWAGSYRCGKRNAAFLGDLEEVR